MDIPRDIPSQMKIFMEKYFIILHRPVLILVVGCFFVSNCAAQESLKKKWSIESIHLYASNSNYSKIKFIPNNWPSTPVKSYRTNAFQTQLGMIVRAPKHDFLVGLNYGRLIFYYEIPDVYGLNNQFISPPNTLEPIGSFFEENPFVELELATLTADNNKPFQIRPQIGLTCRYYGYLYQQATPWNAHDQVAQNLSYDVVLGRDGHTVSIFAKGGFMAMAKRKHLSLFFAAFYAQSFFSPFGGSYKLQPYSLPGLSGKIKVRDSHLNLGCGISYTF